MTKPFDPTKPCQTRLGRRVVIKCTDWPGNQRLCGYIDGEYKPRTWSADGQYYVNDKDLNDLVNFPVTRVGWVLLHSSAAIFDDRSDAVEERNMVACFKDHRIAKIEWEE